MKAAQRTLLGATVLLVAGAFLVLRQSDTDLEARLLGEIQSSNPEIWLPAARELAAGEGKYIPDLIQFLESGDPKKCGAAYRVLRTMHLPALGPKLQSLMKSSQPYTRVAAAMLLWQQGKDKEAGQLLVSTLRNGEEFEIEQVGALEALSIPPPRVGDPDSQDALAYLSAAVDAALDEDTRVKVGVRESAVSAYRRLGNYGRALSMERYVERGGYWRLRAVLAFVPLDDSSADRLRARLPNATGEERELLAKHLR